MIIIITAICSKGGMSMAMYADYVIKNGQVITVDKANGIAEAVAVYDNKIIYVGTNEGAAELAGPKTHVIDASGRSVLPGFIDAHMHMGSTGTNLRWVNCSAKEVHSIEEIKVKLKEAAEKYPKGTLIRAYNYDHMKLVEQRHPSRYDLDEVTPDHQVLLVHTSYHMSVMNSKAIEAAGLTDATPDPDGGTYDREDGVLTGLSRENAHWAVFEKFPFSDQEMEESLMLADQYLSSRGITSIHDAGDGTGMLKSLVDLKNKGKINTRIYAMLFSIYGNAKFIEHYYGIGFHTGFGSDSYKIGPLKIMLDGSSMGGTCALRQPYSNSPDNYGMLMMDQEKVNDYILRAHMEGYQVTAHAIGDKAVEMMLDAIENALNVKPVSDHRHRIEHCAIVDEGLIKRIKKLGVIPIPQPEFLRSSGDTYRTLYGDRVDLLFAAKSYLDGGVPAAFSTDCPVIDPLPFLGIYAACTRETLMGQPIGKDQIVSLLDAIRMYTWNGAFAAFEENIKGSIEVGKLADIIIASKPVLSIPLRELPNVKIDLTMIDGKVVYQDF
jgi:predicted amidohydrolase YtcJ